MKTKLANYVIKIFHNNEEVLYNSITKKILPANADFIDLEKELFLKGQERKCLEKYLSQPPHKLTIQCIPTWRCNLRCSHCSVLHLLEKEQTNNINVELFEKFISEYLEKYYQKLKIMAVSFIGGESMLEVNTCQNVINTCKKYSKQYNIDLKLNSTTNLAYTITREHVKLFNDLTTFTVSIDGNEEQHNLQRRTYDKKSGSNCYNRTVNNLRKLIKLGFRDKINVQAAIRDEFSGYDDMMKFYSLMVSYGIKLKNIFYGGLHPTVLKPKATEIFKASRSQPNINLTPCCKYRWMSNFQINPNNEIYDNFHIQENARLGKLGDSLEQIEETYKNLILGHMPILNDENCIVCPVVAYCWGKCVNGIHAVQKPSEMCAQKQLTDRINKMAEKGELINFSGV